MKNLSIKHKLCFLLLGFAIISSPVAAEEAPPKIQQPPELDQADDGKVPQKNSTTFTEWKNKGGEVREITVKSGPSTYHLFKQDSTVTGRPPSDNVSLPQWKLFEFQGSNNTEKPSSEGASPP